MKMRDLTKAEEQIMQVLWGIQPAFVKDIILELPSPKPAYSTVSTIVRILESKGFIDHEAFGPTHRYSALISKDEYSHFSMKKMLENYFDGSLKQMVSFFSRKENLTIKEMEELLKTLENLKNEKP
ncbi:MAG: BlaI/MecI/CopY family transcriptional regulator [Porphyromonadaceae bacterium]|nr:MAG: BlaI/MecI/CopY family transcriptional regulator [Porphyromonadaceae bacterium]